MSDFGNTPFPRAPLYGAAVLMGAVLLGSATVRLTGIGASKVEDAQVVVVREFRFEDREDGSIGVIDAAQNQVVASIAPGTNGFLRGTLRGLARERKRQSIGPEQPFRLAGHRDGRLTLDDPATGRHIALDSFGPTNSGVFGQLLMISANSPGPVIIAGNQDGAGQPFFAR